MTVIVHVPSDRYSIQSVLGVCEIVTVRTAAIGNPIF